MAGKQKTGGKFGDFENPISGSKGNIFDFKKLFAMLLGFVILQIVAGTSQGIAKSIATRSNGRLDAQYDFTDAPPPGGPVGPTLY